MDIASPSRYDVPIFKIKFRISEHSMIRGT
jgi:hypothetical protein